MFFFFKYLLGFDSIDLINKYWWLNFLPDAISLEYSFLISFCVWATRSHHSGFHLWQQAKKKVLKAHLTMRYSPKTQGVPTLQRILGTQQNLHEYIDTFYVRIACQQLYFNGFCPEYKAWSISNTSILFWSFPLRTFSMWYLFLYFVDNSPNSTISNSSTTNTYTV